MIRTALVLLALVCLLLTGCGVVDSRTEVPRAELDQAKADASKAKAETATVQLTVEDLTAKVTEDRRLIAHATEALQQDTEALQQAREDRLALWLRIIAGIAGLLAIGMGIVAYVIPLVTNLAVKLSAALVGLALVLLYLATHVHALPWMGGGIVFITVGALALKSGALAWLLAHWHVQSAAIVDVAQTVHPAAAVEFEERTKALLNKIILAKMP